MILKDPVQSKGLKDLFWELFDAEYTYLFRKLFIKFKYHRIAKFGSNIDFEKRVILSVLE